MPKGIFSLPNLLSMYRIAVIPVLLFFFYIGGETATWINCFLFFWACITDFADGMVARYTNQTTTFGKFIDHASDKILIGGVLLLLIAFDLLTGLWLIPALIIFLREILVSGLREFLGQYNVAVPVSWMGKWKTAVQMVASGFLMSGEYGEKLVPHAHLIGLTALVLATVMTVLSGWDYLKAGFATLQKIEAEKTPEVV